MDKVLAVKKIFSQKPVKPLTKKEKSGRLVTGYQKWADADKAIRSEAAKEPDPDTSGKLQR